MTAQINLKDITVKFGENKAVNNVNLEINKGDIYGVIASLVQGNLPWLGQLIYCNILLLVL